MMRKLFVAILVVAGLLPSLNTFAAHAQEDSASVAVSAPSDAISAGSDFEAQITVANATNLGHFQFRLRYDTKSLDVVSVVKGSLLGSSGREDKCFEVGGPAEVARDSVGYACVTLGGVPAEGASGDGVLATITFKAKSAASVPLELFDVVLSNPPGEPLPSTTSDASVTVEGESGSDSWMLWIGGGAAILVALVLAAVVFSRIRRQGSAA